MSSQGHAAPGSLITLLPPTCLMRGTLTRPRLWSSHNVSSWQPGMLVVAVTEGNAYKREGSKGDYAGKPTLRKGNRLPNSLGLCLLTTAQPIACAGWGMHVVRARGGYTDNCCPESQIR